MIKWWVVCWMECREPNFPWFLPHAASNKLGVPLEVVGPLGPGVPNKQWPDHTFFWASAKKRRQKKSACIPNNRFPPKPRLKRPRSASARLLHLRTSESQQFWRCSDRHTMNTGCRRFIKKKGLGKGKKNNKKKQMGFSVCLRVRGSQRERERS